MKELYCITLRGDDREEYVNLEELDSYVRRNVAKELNRLEGKHKQDVSFILGDCIGIKGGIRV